MGHIYIILNITFWNYLSGEGVHECVCVCVRAHVCVCTHTHTCYSVPVTVRRQTQGSVLTFHLDKTVSLLFTAVYPRLADQWASRNSPVSFRLQVGYPGITDTCTTKSGFCLHLRIQIQETLHSPLSHLLHSHLRMLWGWLINQKFRCSVKISLWKPV